MPSAAQAQAIIKTQNNTAGQTQHKVNTTKRTTTLATPILNVVPPPPLDNLYSASNNAAPIQLIDLTQRNNLLSEIVVTNSGFIDPVIGISSAITNIVASMSNDAAMSNAFGAPSAVDISQQLELVQANTIASEITKNNSGNIVADLFGIYAIVNNGPIGSLANNVIASNATGAASDISWRDVTQSADFIQANTIGSDITIVNSGAINAATGMKAIINSTFDGSLANNAAISNANGGAAAIELLDLSQSIDLMQANTIGGSIEIRNFAATAGSDTGIFAQINNEVVGSLANNALLSNADGSTAAVDLSDLSQTVDLNQSNEVSADLSLYNYGNLGNNSFGINAEIDNRSIGNLANNAPGLILPLPLGPLSNANGAADAITLSDLAQSFDLQQANSIDNGIGIYNHSQIDSNVGINASIDTENLGGLYNGVTAVNASGQVAGIAAQDWEQSFDVDQLNIVESQIVIANYAGIDAGSAGIKAAIVTANIDELRNTIDVDNLNGVAAAVLLGSLQQSANVTQSNTVFSQIVINDSGANDAQTGIQAEIRSQGLDLINEAEVDDANAAATIISNDALVQTADIVQKNEVVSQIFIQNGGSLTASGTGIRATIQSDALVLDNTASLTSTNDGSVADDLTQTATVEQTNTVSSQIEIANAGSVHAGDIGVSAQILNGSFTLGNHVTGAIGGAGTVADDIIQTASISQTNQVESKIAVNNTGSIWGANRGVLASIDQVSISPSPVNSVSMSGGQSQVIRQTIVTRSISIDNAGSIGAGNMFAIDTEGASTTVTNRAAGRHYRLRRS